MAISEQTFATAKRADTALRQHGYATSARYDQDTERLVVGLHNGVELAVPVHLVEELAGATPENLSAIDISPSGLGLHWPALDVDVYVPALLGGVFVSRSWMASELGAKGGKARSSAKVAASRANGKRGGRPRK